MANTPKKMKDPTEAALSAIQDALQIRDDDTPTQQNAASTPTPTSGPSEEKPWPGLRSKLSNRESARENAKPAQAPYQGPYEEEERTHDPMRLPAANDDRESIGSILRLLQQTPSRTSYLIASIFSAVWIIAGFGLGLVYVPEIQRALDAVAHGGDLAPDRLPDSDDRLACGRLGLRETHRDLSH